MKEQPNERKQAIALKRAVVRLIKRGMVRERIGRPELARRLHASPAQVDRVLDPRDTAVRLDATLSAARAVNQKVRIVVGR